MVSTRQQSNVGVSSGLAQVDHSTSSGSNSGSESSTSVTPKSLRHHASVSASSSSTASSTATAASSSSSSTNQVASSTSYHDGPGTVAVQSFVSSTQLLNLPHEVLEKIFSYIGYKNVSQMRLVCRHLDRVCSSILNSTFSRLQTQMLHRFQSIKAKMPRRESARRNHPLACESDIIETLHMRLTLLQMSFGKHIERKHCCFFAGEILDEVYRILYYIKVTPKLARPYKVTDELFDLSTMAMEYFKEHIEPTLPEIAYFGTDFLEFSASLPTNGESVNKNFLCLDSPPHGQSKSGDESPGHAIGNSSDERTPESGVSTPQSNVMLKKRIRKIKQGMKRYDCQLVLMRRELRHCKGKITDQQKQILEYASRLDENDKKNEETSRKFSTLLQELNKCKTELQYWRSKSPLNPVCVACGKMATQLPGEELPALPNANTGELAIADLAVAEPPYEAAFSATLPGTSAEDVWSTLCEQDNKAAAVQPEPAEEKPQTSVSRKRKSSSDMKTAKSAKKPRAVVFKYRSKRH